MIAPFFQRVIDLIFDKFDDLPAQPEDLGLAFGSYEGTDATLDGTGKRLHEIAFGNEFEGYSLDGLILSILDRIQQHTFEIDIGLVRGDGLEFELDGAVLDRDLFVHHFYEGQLEIEARPQNAFVF